MTPWHADPVWRAGFRVGVRAGLAVALVSTLGLAAAAFAFGLLR